MGNEINIYIFLMVMVASAIQLAVSFSISLTANLSDLPNNGIADIAESNKQELMREIQADYCIDNSPDVLVWEDIIFSQKDINR